MGHAKLEQLLKVKKFMMNIVVNVYGQTHLRKKPDFSGMTCYSDMWVMGWAEDNL